MRPIIRAEHSVPETAEHGVPEQNRVFRNGRRICQIGNLSHSCARLANGFQRFHSLGRKSTDISTTVPLYPSWQPWPPPLQKWPPIKLVRFFWTKRRPPKNSKMWNFGENRRPPKSFRDIASETEDRQSRGPELLILAGKAPQARKFWHFGCIACGFTRGNCLLLRKLINTMCMRAKRARKKLGFSARILMKKDDPKKFTIFCVKKDDPQKIQILKFWWK